MATLKIVLSVLFIIVSLVITIVILFQEGKSAGLGTIAGVADTYWGKNKGRSRRPAFSEIGRASCRERV